MSELKKSGKQKKPGKGKAVSEVGTDPGAWERFEHAVDAAVKSGPKHRRGKPTQPPKLNKDK